MKFFYSSFGVGKKKEKAKLIIMGKGKLNWVQRFPGKNCLLGRVPPIDVGGNLVVGRG